MAQTKGMRILCFNCKSSKDYVLLLKCINEHTQALPFDYIFFTPSRISTYETKNDKSNILSYNFDLKIAGPLGEQVKYLKAYEEMRLNNPAEVNTKLEVFEYVDQTIQRIQEIAVNHLMGDDVNVLVTGSLYVVGAFLECLEFNTDYQPNNSIK
jgi:folylpolyglutamate synthase/dihydropteroate synthase